MDNETVSLTRDFERSFNERIKRDADFRVAILQEIRDCLLNHDLQTGRMTLCDISDAITECEDVTKSIKDRLKDLAHEMNARNNFTEYELNGFKIRIEEIKNRMKDRTLDKSNERDWGIDL